MRTRSGCRIYERDEAIERLEVRATPFQPRRTEGAPTIAGLVPISEIMSPDVICVRQDVEIETVLDLVIRHYIGCVPVVDASGVPIGMITKRDVVEQLACLMCRTSTCHETPTASELAPRTAEEIMLPLAFTLDEHASVARAAAMMAVEDLHHILVVSNTGTVIGMVSSLDIVRWLARNDGVAKNLLS